MRRDRHISLHLELDRGDHPVRAFITEEDEGFQAHWVSDIEFGPFDTLHDVYRWLARTLEATKHVRPV